MDRTFARKTFTPEPPAALARRLARSGRREEAERVVAELLGAQFSLGVRAVSIRADPYSLNSLNGLVTADDGADYFFKFHQEEGEESGPGEYYNARLLHDAGLPVEVPVRISNAPGRQILLYRRVSDPRLADLCRAHEVPPHPGATREGKAGKPLPASPPVPPLVSAEALLAAQKVLDKRVGEVLLETLHPITAAQSESEPIHRLFAARLGVSSGAAREPSPGGRIARFYEGREFSFANAALAWDDLAARTWEINGAHYPVTLAGLFAEARRRLHPAALAACGGVVAHGDAHNANVFASLDAQDGAPPRLRYFDPAFAGAHMPSLLAEIKATFHNVFAHPWWLYEPAVAEKASRVSLELARGRLIVTHDWRLSPLRAGFLESKCRHVWQPLLDALARRDLLPRDWLRQISLALFCCPTLVLPLRPEDPARKGGGNGVQSQNATSALLGLALAIAIASPSEGEESRVSAMRAGEFEADPFAALRAFLGAAAD